MNKFDLSFFQKISCNLDNPESCWEIVRKLWPASIWILKNEYLNTALRSSSTKNCSGISQQISDFLENPSSLLKRGKGCSQILFALTHTELLQKAPYLRHSFALPLIWKQSDQLTQEKFPELYSLEKEIITTTQSPKTWKLSWNFEAPKEISFEENLLDFSSGKTAIIASLLITNSEGTTDPTIWATANWDAYLGIQKVNYLNEKLNTIYDFSGKTLFVPKENEEEAQKINTQTAKERGCSPIEICSFQSAEINPKKALSHYLNKLDFPPDKTSSLEARIAYYGRLEIYNKDSAYNYYVDYLIDDLAEKCNEKMEKEKETITPIENLISFLSLNTGSFLMLGVIRPKRVLLFYTKESEQDLDRFKNLAKRLSTETDLTDVLVETDPLSNQNVAEKITNFIQQHGEAKTALDVTPGPKNFSVYASWLVDPAKTPCLYISQPWKTDRKNTLGEERIIRISKNFA